MVVVAKVEVALTFSVTEDNVVSVVEPVTLKLLPTESCPSKTSFPVNSIFPTTERAEVGDDVPIPKFPLSGYQVSKLEPLVEAILNKFTGW